MNIGYLKSIHTERTINVLTIPSDMFCINKYDHPLEQTEVDVSFNVIDVGIIRENIHIKPPILNSI